MNSSRCKYRENRLYTIKSIQVLLDKTRKYINDFYIIDTI